MDRRRFLFLFGGSTAGIVLAGQGIIALSQRMAVLASGRCSFCLGVSGVRSLAGMIGKPARLCDLCTAWFRSLGEDRDAARSLRVVPPADDRGRAIASWLMSTARVSDLDASELRRRLGDAAERPSFRAGIAEGVATAIAGAPTDLRIRLRVGDLLCKAKANEEGAAQYALVAGSYRQDGFYLKTVAVLKQMDRMHPHPAVRHEIADLYELLGLHSDAASVRRAVARGPVTTCSFCDVSRELATTYPVFDERVCQPCVREAAALFDEHRSA